MPIGTYIHLYASHIEHDYSVELTRQRQHIQDKINQLPKISAAAMDKLGQQLTNLRDSFSGANNIIPKVQLESVRQAIEEEMGDLLQGTGVTIGSNGLLDFSGASAGVGKMRGVRQQSAVDPEQLKAKLAHKINKLYALVTQQQIEPGTSLDLNKLKAMVQQAIDMSRDISGDIRKTHTRLDDLVSGNALNLDKIDDAANNNRLGLLVSYVNAAIQLLAPAAAFAKMRGDWFEAFIAAATAVGNTQIEQTVSDLAASMGSTIKGSGTAVSVLSNQNFNRKLVQNGRLSFLGNEKNAAYTISGNPTQGKVDVRVNISAGEGLETLNISAKNYKLTNEGFGYIHVVSGTSLLFLFQEEMPTFVDSFANVFSHYTDEQSATINLASLRRSYAEEARLAIAYRAITGDVMRMSGGMRVNDSANVMVVRNATTGQMKVTSMHEILNKMLSNSQSLSSKISVKANGSPLEALRFSNVYVEGAPDIAKWQRVGNILEQVHATKISASLNAAMLGGSWA